MTIDLLIIGGGINGCGIAADAAVKGLSVVLCEKDDLAYATSSNSSKLIHGGIRYLEQYQFHLVYESLKEREILMRKAPHLIHPIEFVLPHESHCRSPWLIRLGLRLYDSLYWKRTLPGSKKLDHNKDDSGKPLKPHYKMGFSYYDCQTEDARLVIANAMSAREHGATILTRTSCQSVKRDRRHWTAQLYDHNRQQSLTIEAQAIVNAAGPWVKETIDMAKIQTHSTVRLVKGSHFIVKKLYEGNHAYTLQNADGRVVFALPYQDQFTLIGTTDVPYQGDVNLAKIDANEIEYLCNTINHYFIASISADDIIWSYSGVRPLYDDHASNLSQMTRESYIELNDIDKKLPFISIFGGKITTYRILANKVMRQLKPYFPTMQKTSTENILLPGGACDGLPFSQFIIDLEQQYDWLPNDILHRYAKNYGSLLHLILKDCYSTTDLGAYFGAGLYEKEIDYLKQREWAINADDILWRRTKLGLYLNKAEIHHLENSIRQFN